MKRSVSILLFLVISLYSANAQGPELSYFLESNTIIPWAGGQLYFKSGSYRDIKFFPVNASFRGPLGTVNYSKDIEVNGKLILCLRSWDKYNHKNFLNVFKDKILLFNYDQFNNDTPGCSLSECISELSGTGVKAIVLFSIKDDYPFIKIKDDLASNSDIPVISIDKKGFNSVLIASGYDSEEFFQDLNSNNLEEAIDLITSLRFSIKGNFKKYESPFLTVRFNECLIDSLEMKKVVDINNMALDFIYTLFKSINPEKRTFNITYFSDYDEKLFYTSHWGKGLANGGDIFSVFEESIPAFELSVHELTHTFFYKNWGGNCSFLSEGIAMYAENRSIGSNDNNAKTLLYLQRGELLPLESLIDIEIGADERYTRMGYYASGSFTEFLIENFGLGKFLDLWNLEKGWAKVYNLTLSELERDWHCWLKEGGVKI